MQYNIFRMQFLFSFLLLIATPLASCSGGGSAGTGAGDVSRTFEGTIKSDGTPQEGIRVTLLETDVAAVTGPDGRFSFSAVVPASAVTLAVKVTESASDQFIEIPLNLGQASIISVHIELDPQKLIESVSRFYMWARTVGGCERYFANEAIIRQRRETPPELSCAVRFFVNGETTPLESIPGALEVRSCDSSVWRPLATGETGAGPSAGVGEIPFTFIDNERNCEYRIVAPFDAAPLPELSVLIQTLTLQRKPRA